MSRRKIDPALLDEVKRTMADVRAIMAESDVEALISHLMIKALSEDAFSEDLTPLTDAEVKALTASIGSMARSRRVHEDLRARERARAAFDALQPLPGGKQVLQ